MSDEKKPCRECPFSKSTMPGWLGSYDDTSQLHALVSNEDRMPCHLPIDYETSADELAMQERRGETCVGYLAYSRNTAKRFTDRRLKIEAEAVGKRDDVFASPMEMHDFHTDLRPPSKRGKA